MSFERTCRLSPARVVLPAPRWRSCSRRRSDDCWGNSWRCPRSRWRLTERNFRLASKQADAGEGTGWRSDGWMIDEEVMDYIWISGWIDGQIDEQFKIFCMVEGRWINWMGWWLIGWIDEDWSSMYCRSSILSPPPCGRTEGPWLFRILPIITLLSSLWTYRLNILCALAALAIFFLLSSIYVCTSTRPRVDDSSSAVLSLGFFFSPISRV